MTNKVEFTLTITEDYQLKCSYITSEKKETTIKLQEKEQEFYPITISFENNKVLICEEQNENTIAFMKEWVDNPQNFKLYNVQFQEKEYQLSFEVLFALIINKFKHQIEKEFIIENTIVNIPSNNGQMFKRIKYH